MAHIALAYIAMVCISYGPYGLCYVVIAYILMACTATPSNTSPQPRLALALGAHRRAFPRAVLSPVPCRPLYRAVPCRAVPCHAVVMAYAWPI